MLKIDPKESYNVGVDDLTDAHGANASLNDYNFSFQIMRLTISVAKIIFGKEQST